MIAAIVGVGVALGLAAGKLRAPRATGSTVDSAAFNMARNPSTTSDSQVYGGVGGGWAHYFSVGGNAPSNGSGGAGPQPGGLGGGASPAAPPAAGSGSGLSSVFEMPIGELEA